MNATKKELLSIEYYIFSESSDLEKCRRDEVPSVFLSPAKFFGFRFSYEAFEEIDKLLGLILLFQMAPSRMIF